MGGRRWTEAELLLLEDMLCKHTVAECAKILNRSFDAVNIKANRLGYGGFLNCTDMWTINQICITCSIDSRTVKRWIANKWLRSYKRGIYRCVRFDALVDFLRSHQEQYNTCKGDWYFIKSEPWYEEKHKRDMENGYTKQWTSNEISVLKAMYRHGRPLNDIASATGRTYNSIRCKVHEINSKGEMYC